MLGGSARHFGGLLRHLSGLHSLETAAVSHEHEADARNREHQQHGGDDAQDVADLREGHGGFGLHAIEISALHGGVQDDCDRAQEPARGKTEDAQHKAGDGGAGCIAARSDIGPERPLDRRATDQCMMSCPKPSGSSP